MNNTSYNILFVLSESLIHVFPASVVFKIEEPDQGRAQPVFSSIKDIPYN